MTATNMLETIRVASIMSTDVVEVEVNQSMCSAAACLCERGLSAAPVVDEQGHCVGVLTGADFIKRECRHGEHAEGAFEPQDFELVQRDGLEPLHIEAFPEDRVRNHMTPSVQSITPDATVARAATVMLHGRVHHLVVLDEHERPSGMLSTFDVISAMLSASGGDQENA